ncbi:MAG TPA: tail fiber domain-containing protein [Bacteroidaceae bacterium]|nr:tail fiber domain-containing protein [Bacteroidaceae bacterium]
MFRASSIRKLTGVCILLIISVNQFSQVPQGFRFQAVARDHNHTIMVNRQIIVTVGILADSEEGELLWQEEHAETTNDLGLFTLVICKDDNTKTGGSATSLSDIPWGSGAHFMHLEIDSGDGPVNLGTQQLLPVPYAIHAFSAKETDGDPENEIQDLQLEDGQLTITGNSSATPINLGTFVSDRVGWEKAGNNVVYVNGNVGVGTITPEGRLTVQGVDETDNQPLFEVRRKDGYPVFAVYEDGVWAYTDTVISAKGVKGGFAVGGYRNSSKGLPGEEFFRVTPDSVRIYFNDEPGKGVKGGFAVGGYSSGSKGPTREYLRVTDDSTRVYVNAEPLKGVKGGFAVGGYHNNNKQGDAETFMSLTPDNYFIGHKSGQSVTTGTENSVLGFESGQAITRGNRNSFMGFRSGYHNDIGHSNLFLGAESGFQNRSGNENTFLGIQSGYTNETGNKNSFIGSYAGYNNREGDFNSFVGSYSGHSNTSGSYNTMLGYNAGYKNDAGNYNSFFGFQAGFSNQNGNNNLFLGNSAGYANESASSNVFIGFRCGRDHINGNDNVFIGHEAGLQHREGKENIFIGSRAGRNAEGGGNIAIGFRSGEGNTTGYSNVFISVGSGLSNTTGYSNVFVGDQAGVSNTRGYENVYIGRAAGVYCDSGFHNVFLGYMSGWGEQESNRLHIGYPTLIYGQFDNRRVGINTTNPQEALSVNGNIGFTAGGNRHVSLPDGAHTLFIGSNASNARPWGVLTEANGYIGMYLNGAYQSGIRIIGSGQVGFGVLNPVYRIELPNNASDGIGKGRAYEWATYSDSRVKSDFESIPYGLEAIMELVPKKYQQHNSSYENGILIVSEDSRSNIGLIAQELVEIIPEAVNRPGNNENDLWSISYDKLIPVLINGIKEQQAIIVNQQMKLEMLESEIKEILEQLATIPCFNTPAL